MLQTLFNSYGGKQVFTLLQDGEQTPRLEGNVGVRHDQRLFEPVLVITGFVCLNSFTEFMKDPSLSPARAIFSRYVATKKAEVAYVCTTYVCVCGGVIWTRWKKGGGTGGL